MSAVIVPIFGPKGQPFDLDALNAALAAIVSAVNTLSTEPLLQHGVAPGNQPGYLPLTGGQLSGQLGAPSVVVGPAGSQYAVVVSNQVATAAVAGLVKMAAALADVSVADADATYGQPEADLINALKTGLNQLLTNLRAAGVQAP